MCIYIFLSESRIFLFLMENGCFVNVACACIFCASVCNCMHNVDCIYVFAVIFHPLTTLHSPPHVKFACVCGRSANQMLAPFTLAGSPRSGVSRRPCTRYYHLQTPAAGKLHCKHTHTQSNALTHIHQQSA